MILNHSAQEFCAVNCIIGLAIDRLPNGRVIACEVRKDEAGELRVPIAQMSLEDLYALAARLHLEILPSKFAGRTSADWPKGQMRREKCAEHARRQHGRCRNS
jgi:hypothetical protein